MCSATAGLLFYRKRFATCLWGFISAVTSIASSPDHAQHMETSEKVLLVSDAVNQQILISILDLSIELGNVIFYITSQPQSGISFINEF